MDDVERAAVGQKAAPAQKAAVGQKAAVTRKLAALAETRQPVLTRSEILGCGMSRGDLRHAVESGVFVKVGRGLYTPAVKLARAADDPALRHALEAAAMLARIHGTDAVVSHTSAARIHGLDLLDQPADGHVTLTRPPGRNDRSPAHVYQASLPGTHVTRVHEVRVVVPGRAVHDIAREHGFAAGLVTADSLLRRHAADPPALRAAEEEIHRVVRDCRGWPFSLVAAKVARFADHRSESAFESLSRAEIIDSHLPMPHLQVCVPELPRYRVDFLWPDKRVIAEPDGLSKYKDNPWRVGEEKIRQEKIREAGYGMVHYIWKEMRYHPETVLARIDAAFERARRLGYW